MRRGFILLVILAQLLVLGFMAGKREYVYAKGTRIYLRTAPIDPRDPFRGDFVRLQYPFSQVDRARFRGALKDGPISKGSTIYGVFRQQPDGLYDLEYLSDARPAAGLFIKGRTVHHWDLTHQQWLGVKFGIEQYFVEQGRGKEIEKTRGQRNELQVPMEIELAVGGDGTAVIRAYRWSALGIQLELLRAPAAVRRNEQTDPALPLSPRLRLTLANVSDAPLAVANPGDNCGWTLEAVLPGNQPYPPTDDHCASIQTRGEDFRILQAGQRYSTEVDLGEARWHVLVDGEAREIGALTAFNQFRLVYRAPIDADHKLPAPLWLGELASPAFNASGRVD